LNAVGFRGFAPMTYADSPPAETPPEFRQGDCLPMEVLQRHLGACGDSVRVFRGCRLVGAPLIRLGQRSQIDESVFLFAGEGIDIGAYVHIAAGAVIFGGGSCRLGDFSGIGSAVRLVTGTEEVQGLGLTNPTVPVEFRMARRGHVEVGAHAVVFTGSIVLPGVTIGEGAVVSAGSIVHHDLKPWGIYAGNPLICVGIRPKERVLELADRVLGRGDVASKLIE
jgi:serine acetyltransferase